MPKRIYTRAFATVRFMAPDLDPLEITVALRLPPDFQYRRGEPRIGRSAKGIINEYAPYRAGMWAMSSEKWVHSPKLETHLRWLLGELEPRAAAIQSLNIVGLEIDFFCFSVGRSPSPPSLSKLVKARAERLGITIEIDHCDSSGDDRCVTASEGR